MPGTVQERVKPQSSFKSKKVSSSIRIVTLIIGVIKKYAFNLLELNKGTPQGIVNGNKKSSSGDKKSSSVGLQVGLSLTVLAVVILAILCVLALWWYRRYGCSHTDQPAHTFTIQLHKSCIANAINDNCLLEILKVSMYLTVQNPMFY